MDKLDAILSIVNNTQDTINLEIYLNGCDHPVSEGWEEYNNVTFSKPIYIISQDSEVQESYIKFDWYGIGEMTLNPSDQIQFRTLKLGEVYTLWEDAERSNFSNHNYHLVKKKRSGAIEESAGDAIVQNKDLIDFDIWNKQGVTEIVHIIFIEDGASSTVAVDTDVQYTSIVTDGQVLPDVGGTGTYYLYILGSLLILFSVIMLFLKKKLRNLGNS